MAKVLVIEDEAGIQMLLKRIISSMGHDVSAAGDGQPGCDLAAQLKPDLIITDLGLPGEPRGRKLVLQLHEQSPGSRIVISSGDQPQPADWAPLGVTDFLNKPFDMMSVKRLVERVLAG